MGYSVASGELKQIGASVTTDGIVEASSLEIGDNTLHDVSYNESLAVHLKAGERMALLLTPTRYIVAVRLASGEVIYASADNQEYLEEPMPVPYLVGMGLLGLMTTFLGIGLIIILSVIKTYTKRRDIIRSLAAFRVAAL